jgi:hypothetical protein
MVEVGPISASHGGVCIHGAPVGTFEGAYTLLKNRAVEMGATYVQILDQVEPVRSGPACSFRYVIRGVAYRDGAGG